jgi:predicted MFS family arabinose efflux permease
MSTRAGFFMAGFGLAAWAPLVPYAKERLHLNDATLGLLLLCLGAGSMVSMPLASALTGRFGCRRLICCAVAMVAFALPFLASVDSVVGTAIALLVFGGGMGAAEVAVNIQAVEVERRAGRKMMSGFHGLFSLGGLVGAGACGALLSVGGSAFVAAMAASIALVILLAVSARHFLSDRAPGGVSLSAIPRGIVLVLGLLCFIVFLVEGAMLDWSALLLISAKSIRPSSGGIGYMCFAIAMTSGRLMGDRAAQRMGPRMTICVGSTMAVAGLVIAVVFPDWRAAVAGFALIGLGCSNIVPVFYSAAGRQRAMALNPAVGAISTMGYAGILAGPALVGYVAHASTLTVAFGLLAVLMGIVGVCGSRVVSR